MTYIDMRIIFFGTGEFSVPALKELMKQGWNIIAIITKLDKSVGRGLKTESPLIKKIAKNLGLVVLQPKTLKSEEALVELKNLKPDLGIVVAYGKIIPDNVLALFPKGIINIHPSLLPKYRGPSPIQAALLNGDKETGVTIMLIDQKMDRGPILAYSMYRVAYHTTGYELSKALSELGAKLLIETLPKWLYGDITPKPQDHEQATFTKLLEREDGRLDWTKSAEYIERMIRAYDLWPGTWTQWDGKPIQSSVPQNLQSGKRLKILRATLLHSTIGCATNSKPGYVWQTDDGRLAINCNPGSLILELLQIEGRKPLSGIDFLHGYPKFLGLVLS